jgi:hypothetical protein
LLTATDAPVTPFHTGEGSDRLPGETGPSLQDRILRTVPARVTADTDAPAFVVRNTERPEA